MIKSLLRALHGPIYARRLETLSALMAGLLVEGDRVLDVGCGFGALGKAIMAADACPDGVVVEGIERNPRGDEVIPVHAYPGGRLPFDDGAFDVTILADVLHHDVDPDALLRECARVARRLVIVKDHKPEGIAGYRRICLLDWAANSGYDVKCLYQYPTLEAWRAQFRALPATIVHEERSLDLYPAGWNFVFGGRLHYVAALDVTTFGRA